jgi:hypothetical protein
MINTIKVIKSQLQFSGRLVLARIRLLVAGNQHRKKYEPKYQILEHNQQLKNKKDRTVLCLPATKDSGNLNKLQQRLIFFSN